MTLSVQFLSLLAMIGTGIAAGAFIDMIGTGTAHAGKKSIIRRRAAWFEVIGWILIGSGTFYILFLVRDGAWRIYDPVAQISGMLLYATFFYRPLRLLGRVLLMLIVKPVWFVIHLIVSLIRQIIRLVSKLVALPLRPIVKLFRIMAVKLFNKREK
ncbi:spore cortex biosynthesis protein YabQ [Sporosarcina sp. FSL K6-1522]|uniref:spore cortex biosynthesis protein YabQ n=1 Tax=Sporosarcina sp. FSL K6-1522 TaxID=2921554 RepID=UPI003159EC3E